MTLNEIELNETVKITKINGTRSFRHHLYCMGCFPHSSITFVKKTPFNNPLLFRVHSYVLALGIQDAEKIEVMR